MDGVAVILKPPGMTSSNAVYDVRRIFQEKRAGHLGTLDPGAAGVLPVCIGRATKLFDHLVDKEKEYVFELRLGQASDTQDAYGRLVRSDGRVVTPEQLAAILPSFLGTQKQVASVYSALKVNGRRMCDMARAGESVEPRERDVTIHSLNYIGTTGENRFLLRTRCSRGTYIRALAEDIGVRLSTCAYMSFLLRTASGPFSLEHAYSIAELEQCKENGTLESCLVSCEEALSFLPAVTLPAERMKAAKNALDTFVAGQPDGPVRLYCEGFLGVGEVCNGQCKLAVHLYQTDRE